MKGKMDGEKEVKDEDTREIICWISISFFTSIVK
jgi:hypothetical protein